MATESDEKLLIKIQSGDRWAFAELVKRHTDKFYRLAYRYMQDKGSAEDTVQSVFLKLWENPSIWRSDKATKFTTWFYRIVVNFCLDQKKSFKNFTTLEGVDVEDDRINQEEIVNLKQKQDFLNAKIAQLPDRQKTALILCFYEDLSHKEAAEIMKVNLKTLQSLLMRAKENLKKMLI